MELAATRALGTDLLREFGLLERGWRFVLDGAMRRFGQCRYTRREISVSRYMANLNPPNEVEITIRHEIAHALAGPGAGHGPKWKAQCAVVGIAPNRCYDMGDRSVVEVPKRFALVCDSGCRIERHRRPSGRYACRRHGLELTVTTQ